MSLTPIGIQVALEGVAEYERDLRSVTRETRALKSALDLAAREDNPFTRASQMQGVLTTEIGTQQEKIKLLKEAYQNAEDSTGKFSEQTLKARDALNKAEIALDAMNKQLKDLPNGLENWGDDILKASEKFSSTGQEFKAAAKPFWGITGTVVAGLTAATKITADFEQQMAAVKAVSNATEDDFAALEKQARYLGETTKFTATESAYALELLSRAGFDAKTSIAMSDSVLALAAADAIEFGDAADVAANMMHIFGLATDDMSETQANAARVADTLAQASRSANTDVLTIAETAKYAAPSFAALGWTIEDMAFAIDLAADYGIKGSQAGTGLRQAFKNLEAPTDKIKEAMAQYGITLDDGTGNAMKFGDFMTQLRGVFSDLEVDVMDANGEMKDGETIMQEYGESLPISQMEKLQAIADIFGTRAMPTILAMIGTGTEKYNELSAAVYNAGGAAKEMQDIMINTTEGQLTILLSQLQELAISFGELLVPVLRDAIGIAQNFVDKLNSLDEGTRKVILTGALASAAIAPILSGIGGVIGGIGNIMSVGGHLIKGTGKLIHLMSGAGGVAESTFTVAQGFGALLSGIGSAGKGLIGGIGKLAAAAAPFMFPQGLIVAAILGTGIAIAANWDWVKEKAGKAASFIAEQGKSLINGFKDLGAGFAEWCGGVAERASELGSRIAENIKGSLNDLKNFGGNVLNFLKGQILMIGEGILNIMTYWINKAKNWGSELVSNIASGITSKVSKVTSAASKVAQGVKNILGHSTPKEGPLHHDDKWGSHMMQNFIGGINDNISPLKHAVTKAAGMAGQFMNVSGSVGNGYAILPTNRYIDLPDIGNSYSTNMGGVSFQIYQQPGQDAQELAEIIEEKIVAMEMRRQYAYGAI